MSIYLNDVSGNALEFQNTLPAGYSGPRLKGSQVFYFAKDAYKLIVQEIRTDLFTLRLNIFGFLEALTLDTICRKEGIHSRTLLKGNLRHKINDSGKINLREGEFTMLWAESDDSTTQKIKYAMVITVEAPGVNNLYDLVVRKYATQLEALRPVIEISVNPR